MDGYGCPSDWLFTFGSLLLLTPAVGQAGRANEARNVGVADRRHLEASGRSGASADRPDPKGALAWDLVAGAYITLSLSVGTEISLRFLGGGTDWIGAFSTMAQALLAVLAGSTFTDTGRAWLDRRLERRKAGALLGSPGGPASPLRC